LQESGPGVFETEGKQKQGPSTAEIESLRAKVGELLMERDFLKKALAE